jgi:hypothetical protein
MSPYSALTLALCLAALLPSAALAQRTIDLGPAFNGTYAPEGMACEGLALIEVQGGTMVGAEFAISITDIIEFPGEANRIEASLLNQGGGGEWEDSAILTLAEDGQSLRFDYPDGSRVIWTRCN